MAIAGGGDHELPHHLPSDLTEPAEQLAVVEEVRPQHLGDGEGPQVMPDLLEHLFGEQDAEQSPPLGGTRRTEPPLLAGERDQVLGPAAVAAHAGEAVVVDAAVEKGIDGLLDGAAPEPVAGREALLPLALDLLVGALAEAVQRRALRWRGRYGAGQGCGRKAGLLPEQTENGPRVPPPRARA